MGVTPNPPFVNGLKLKANSSTTAGANPAGLNDTFADALSLSQNTSQTVTGPISFSGAVTAPTRTAGDNSTNVATTAFVSNAVKFVINVLDWLPAGQPDGTTDNTTQLQAAINAAAGVAPVYFPKTTHNYVITVQNVLLEAGANNFGALVIPSNSHLIIDGTLFLKANSLGGLYSSAIYMQDVTSVVIEGRGIIDGNRANQAIGAFPANFQSNILAHRSNNLLIRGLILQNSSGSGLNIYGSSNVLVDNIQLLNSLVAHQFGGNPGGFTGTQSTNCWIRNSYIHGTQDFGFAFYDGVTNSGITNCVVTGGTSVGIGVLTDGGFFYMADSIVIDSNIITDNARGISVEVANTAIGHGVHTNITISNNQISGNTDSGIFIDYTDGILIQNNMVALSGFPNGTAGIIIADGTSSFVVTDNLLTANSNGIAVNGTSLPTNGTISRNMIRNSGGNGAANASGIIIQILATNLLISDNVIYDDQTIPTMLLGIFFQNGVGAGVILANNSIRNQTSNAYQMTAADDTIVECLPGASDITTRVVTAAGSITMLGSDHVVVINKTVGAATAVTLITSPAKGRRVTIVDGKGDCSTNAITITPASGLINGAANLVMNTAYSSATLLFTGTNWSIV